MEASMSEAQGFAHPEFLVETDWLAAQLGDPKLVVLDCTMHLIPDPKITYPVETGPAKPRPAAKFVVREDRKLMVGKEAVLGAIGDRGVCTINALTAPQHAGSGGNTYGRPGRIAGSVNVPAAALLDPESGTFLPAP